jgi:hypothetical protein
VVLVTKYRPTAKYLGEDDLVRIHSDNHGEVRGLSADEFLALYQARWDSLLRFFVARTFDPEVAAELTAESFAEAFSFRTRFDPARGEATPNSSHGGAGSDARAW